ncbi:hypothetical protein EDB86DRAFT_2830641 [Lactarius hatsudake]|nr:hypothetical protein EDB86DRAFT_2830641 [Lactarius hatsudake]
MVQVMVNGHCPVIVVDGHWPIMALLPLLPHPIAVAGAVVMAALAGCWTMCDSFMQLEAVSVNLRDWLYETGNHQAGMEKRCCSPRLLCTGAITLSPLSYDVSPFVVVIVVVMGGCGHGVVVTIVVIVSVKVGVIEVAGHALVGFAATAIVIVQWLKVVTLGQAHWHVHQYHQDNNNNNNAGQALDDNPDDDDNG